MAFKVGGVSVTPAQAVGFATGGVAGGAAWGAADKAMGGRISKEGGNMLSGTSSDAGILGVGQYKAKGANINGQAFNDDESEARQAEFAKQLAASQGRQAPTMAAAQLGPAAQAQAAQVGPAAQAQAAQINQAQQAQFRSQQAGLAAQLAAQAQGQGPSLAQMQLKQGTDRSLAQAMAMAASQRGVNPALAARQAAQQQAAIGQQAAGQAAQLRMQEQMAAQQALAGVVGAGREQDIGLATNQAGLQQQAALANQGATNQFQLTQAGFNQDVGLANQSSANQFALAQAQLAQQAAANNQQAALQQTGLNDQASQFFNAGMMNMEQADRDALMALEQLKVNQNVGIAGANQAGYAAASKARGDLIGNLGEALAAASDERLKTNIESGERDIRDFAKSLKAYSYDYKDPKFGEGKHVSPMAQDIEKTKLGKGLVVDTPEGKMVHYGKAGGLLLATAGMLSSRLDEMDAKLAKAFSKRRAS